MLTASDVVKKYISFFEKQGHKKIPNSPLVPLDDPSTLFTSSGMQPLVPFLLGEQHPQGKRLADVQNCFRAQDIDEIGDNRHTTFFRMLGNWSLGDYFKKEQLPWFFTFLTDQKEGLGLDPSRLYVTVFAGNKDIAKDDESVKIWQEVFQTVGIEAKVGERIFAYGVEKNWWSRAGIPEKMPVGEPGGPDSEVFYDYGTPHDKTFGDTCHVNCDCGRFVEIGNSVFMQYQKQENGSFKELPQQNVDFGGGLERLVAASENKQDVFETNLFFPIIQTLEKYSGKSYKTHAKSMRIITDHFIAASFIVSAGVTPSNTEQGYILRRLVRRGIDHIDQLGKAEMRDILETIVAQYKQTDPKLEEHFEKIVFTVLEEEQMYRKTQERAKSYVVKKYKEYGDDFKGVKEITADDAFVLYSTHGLSPTQIESLGYVFDRQAFAEKMKSHKDLSRTASAGKFRGGLADHQERTVMGHTATHLLHKALRDLLGTQVHQTGSNITTERLRFDFNYDKKLTDEQIKHLEEVINKKIAENMPVHFEMIPTEEAHKIGAIGLFMDTYGDKSKIYFIGGDATHPQNAYSIEFCGGPHVDFTSTLKGFKIIKQENIGHGQRRIYAVVGK